MIINICLLSIRMLLIRLWHDYLLSFILALSVFIVCVPFFISQILLCLDGIMWWRMWLGSLIISNATRINIDQPSAWNSHLINIIFYFYFLFHSSMTSPYSCNKWVCVFTFRIITFTSRLVTIIYRFYRWAFSICILLLLWILSLVLIIWNNVWHLILN